MDAKPPRKYTRLAVAIIVAAVVIAASALSYSSFEATMTTTQLVTVATGITTTITTGYSPPNSTSVANGIWNFTVTLNATQVGIPTRAVQLVATLTNIGSTNETITNFIEPYIDPAVFNSAGTLVWQWGPSQQTVTSLTIQPGHNISQALIIPSNAGAGGGQWYFIRLTPDFIPSQENLAVTMEFYREPGLP